MKHQAPSNTVLSSTLQSYVLQRSAYSDTWSNGRGREILPRDLESYSCQGNGMHRFGLIESGSGRGTENRMEHQASEPLGTPTEQIDSPMSTHRSQSGFTLIELLVVVAILATLAGVVVYAARNIVSQGDQDACLLEKRTLSTAKGVADATDNPTDTYLDFVESPVAPRYFVRSNADDFHPTWGPSARHPGGKCPNNF